MNTFQKPIETASLNLSTTADLHSSYSSAAAAAAAFGLLLGGFGGQRNESHSESLGTGSLIGAADLMAAKGSSFPRLKVSRSRKERTRRVGRFKGVVFEDFPPFLSTLDEKSGRPMFNMVKERNDGRLVMVMIRNEEPVIVRSCGGGEESDGGGVRMEMVMAVECGGEYDEDAEDDIQTDLEIHEVDGELKAKF